MTSSAKDIREESYMMYAFCFPLAMSGHVSLTLLSFDIPDNASYIKYKAISSLHTKSHADDFCKRIFIAIVSGCLSM